MSAEIEKVTTIVEEGIGVLPGRMLELDTPAGKVQVIGTEKGFAIRRPGTTEFDVRYENGETLKINYKDGTVKTVTAVRPEDWQANEMLDPML